MSTDFQLRPLETSDGPALADLILACPDTGRIHFTYHYYVDPIEDFRVHQGDYLGVVAEASECNGLVGAGLVRFYHAMVDGVLRPCALLNTLLVHPAYRRRGIATALVEWRIRAARERVGDKGIIRASIQSGNTGSFRTVTKFLKQVIPDRVCSIPMKTSHRRPKLPNSWVIRPAHAEELEQIAGEVNRFYGGCNFYEPQTGEKLTEWLGATVNGKTFRKYIVLTDKAGALLGGVGVSEEYHFGALHVDKMSLSLKVLNFFLRLVPPDGDSRHVNISKFWYSDDKIEVLKYLVAHALWQYRQQASMVIVHVDANSMYLDAFPKQPWTPVTKSSIVADAPFEISSERLIVSG